jgi:hypothetical protein
MRRVVIENAIAYYYCLPSLSIITPGINVEKQVWQSGIAALMGELSGGTQ